MDGDGKEEFGATGRVAVIVNEHGELCGFHKPGGLPACSLDTLLRINQIATIKAFLPSIHCVPFLSWDS